MTVAARENGFLGESLGRSPGNSKTSPPTVTVRSTLVGGDMSVDSDTDPLPSETEHFTIEIRYSGDSVEGTVVRDGTAGLAAFSGWMELLRLLEAPSAPDAVVPPAS
jgi:hypothetical protein